MSFASDGGPGNTANLDCVITGSCCRCCGFGCIGRNRGQESEVWSWRSEVGGLVRGSWQQVNKRFKCKRPVYGSCPRSS